MMKWLGTLILIMACVAVPGESWAQSMVRKRVTVVTLFNGTQVQGRLVQRIPAGVVLELENGSRVLYDGDRIRSVRSRWIQVDPSKTRTKNPPKRSPERVELDTFVGRTRLDLSAELGVNGCISAGVVDCVGRTALPRGRLSFALSVDRGTQGTGRLMLGLDLSVGGFGSPYAGQDGVTSATVFTLHVLPTLRYLVENGRFRTTLGIGIGYGSLFYKTSGSNSEGPFGASRQESGVAVTGSIELGGRITSMISLALHASYTYQTILSACEEQSWDNSDLGCSNVVIGTVDTTPSQQVALHMFTIGLSGTFSFGF